MAGAGYKLFNTGDVLTAAQVNTYLMEQTVMVFADAAARTTALTGVVSEGMLSYLKSTKQVEVYNGSAWVASDDPNAIQNTIVDAKGDLITATAADTPARLAVGNNGETIVADSSTSTGLRYNPHIEAGKNFLINGGFDIWQRGTSLVNTSGYTADRWTNGGSLNAVTFSQQTSGAPDGARYFARLTSNGASSYSDFTQIIETNNVSLLWGKTVTFSIKIRRNSTVNNTGLIIAVRKSSTADAGAGASWTNISSTNVANASIPTGSTSADWYTFTSTVAIPNDGTANTLQVYIAYNGATASGSVFEFAQAQLEIGSTVTAFSRAGGTIQGELAACQRYYYRFNGTGNYSRFGLAQAYQATGANLTLQFPVTMRVAPTALEQSGTASHYGIANAGFGAIVACTAVPTFDRANRQVASIQLTTGGGLSTGAAAQVVDNDTSSAYFGWSAEL